MAEKITREMAKRFFENIDDKTGEWHAFVIAMCGDDIEKGILKARMIEWCKGYPVLTENLEIRPHDLVDAIYGIYEDKLPELPEFDLGDEK